MMKFIVAAQVIHTHDEWEGSRQLPAFIIEAATRDDAEKKAEAILSREPCACGEKVRTPYYYVIEPV